MTSELRFEINLLPDLSVVTKDGEYLGTWDTDEPDAIYEFTPDGADEPLLRNPFMGFLCKAIAGGIAPGRRMRNAGRKAGDFGFAEGEGVAAREIIEAQLRPEGKT